MGRKAKPLPSRASGGSRSSFTTAVALLALLVAVAAGWWVAQHRASPAPAAATERQPAPSGPRLPGIQTFDEFSRAFETVPVARRSLRGASSALVYRDLADLRVPLILTSTIADGWRARKLWTKDYLVRTLKSVPVQKQRTRSFATFHDGKAMEPYLSNIKWEDFNMYSKVNPASVYSTSDAFFYFSSNINKVEPSPPQNFTEHILPLHDLLFRERFQSNIWMGKSGLITHSHLDSQYNFFVQLQGRKRFTLFAPQAPLPLYSALHPHYGHAWPAPSVHPAPATGPGLGLGGKDFTAAAVNGSLPLVAFVADLEPGDMLLVPPFWFHHVETLEDSVSVNVWSTAPEYELINQVYEIPLPFEAEWPLPDMALAAHAYLSALFEALQAESVLPAGETITDFVAFLLRERWDWLVSTGQFPANANADARFTAVCSGGHAAMVQRTLERHGAGVPAFQRGLRRIVPLFRAIREQAALRDAAPGAADTTGGLAKDPWVAKLLRDTRDASAEAILRQLLRNYVEHLARVVLDVPNVLPFLTRCFAT